MSKYTVAYIGFFWFLIQPCLVQAETLPQSWSLDAESSTLRFVFDQAGSKQQGQFRSFSATFWFEPDRPETGRFELDIDITSLDTGEPERDQILRSADMFAVEKWPRAAFRAFNIRSKGKNRYLADAELTIRDQTRRLDFPFVLNLLQDGAAFRLQTELYIKRLDYGVGQEDWATTSWIADEVKIEIEVVARKAP